MCSRELHLCKMYDNNMHVHLRYQKLGHLHWVASGSEQGWAGRRRGPRGRALVRQDQHGRGAGNLHGHGSARRAARRGGRRGVHTSKGAAGDAGLWHSRDLAGSAWGLRHVPRAGEVRPAETRCPLCVACSRGPSLAVRSTAPRGSRCDLRCPRSSRCAKRAAEGPGQRFAFSCFVRGRGDVS